MGTLPTVCGMGAKAEAGAHFPVLPATLFSQQTGFGEECYKADLLFIKCLNNKLHIGAKISLMSQLLLFFSIPSFLSQMHFAFLIWYFYSSFFFFFK